MSNGEKEIKIRISKESDDCKCDACEKLKKKEQKEFYDVYICGTIFHFCYDCLDVLFHKTLKAEIKYQGKIKTPNKNIRR